MPTKTDMFKRILDQRINAWIFPEEIRDIGHTNIQ